MALNRDGPTICAAIPPKAGRPLQTKTSHHVTAWSTKLAHGDLKETVLKERDLKEKTPEKPCQAPIVRHHVRKTVATCQETVTTELTHSNHFYQLAYSNHVAAVSSVSPFFAGISSPSVAQLFVHDDEVL